MAVARGPNVVRILDCTGIPGHSSRLLKELSGLASAEEGLTEVKWKIDNRYYSAEVTVTSHDITGLDNTELAPLEAVIFLCLINDLEHLEKIQSGWKKLSDEPPPVCLLVAILTCKDSIVEETMKWCVENCIELVEWNIEERNINEDDDIVDDADEGIPRVVQALQAHVWPEMIMKGDKKSQSNVAAAKKPTIDDLLPKEAYSNNVQGIDPDPGGESFEELFSQFASMKAHAESLPHEERKAYAEKVVMSFWKAIGGDDEELNLNDNNSDHSDT